MTDANQTKLTQIGTPRCDCNCWDEELDFCVNCAHDGRWDCGCSACAEQTRRDERSRRRSPSRWTALPTPAVKNSKGESITSHTHPELIGRYTSPVRGYGQVDSIQVAIHDRQNLTRGWTKHSDLFRGVHWFTHPQLVGRYTRQQKLSISKLSKTTR